jgi:hypothetical protein
MSTAGWLARNVAMLVFKRISDGFLVAPPRLLPFPWTQHYVATGAQLAQIEAREAIIDFVYGLAVSLLVVIAFIVAETGLGRTDWFLTLYTLAVVAVAAGSQIATWHAAGPLLAGLPRSTERITFGERARMTAAAWWQLLCVGLLYALLAVWLAPAGFNGLASYFGFYWATAAAAWFWAIVWADVAGYHLYLGALKLKRALQP